MKFEKAIKYLREGKEIKIDGRFSLQAYVNDKGFMIEPIRNFPVGLEDIMNGHWEVIIED